MSEYASAYFLLELVCNAVTIEGKYMSDDGSSVNYKEMGRGEEFKEYVDATVLLADVQLDKLSQDEVCTSDRLSHVLYFNFIFL